VYDSHARTCPSEQPPEQLVRLSTMPAATDAPKHSMTSRGNSRRVIPVLSMNTTLAPTFR